MCMDCGSRRRSLRRGVPDGGVEMTRDEYAETRCAGGEAVTALLALLCVVGLVFVVFFTLALCAAAAKGDEQLGIRDRG